MIALDAVCHEITLFAQHNGRGPGVSELERWCGMREGHASYYVEKLTSHGLIRVEREAKGAGHRTTRIELTPVGRAASADSQGIHAAPRASFRAAPQRVNGPVRGADLEQHRRRVAIAHEVVKAMGTTRDEDTIETCPVICEVLRRWNKADLGEFPCTLEEIGTILGVSRERIRQIEARAMSKMHAELTRARMAIEIVEALRGLDIERRGEE